MDRLLRSDPTGLLAVVLMLSVPLVACKRGPLPADKETMARLAGTWEWRQPNAAVPTIIVLELTAKGAYKESTYQEIAGQRRLLYINRRSTDLVPEPEIAADVAKLKSGGYEPALERGEYRIAPAASARAAPSSQIIVFENEKLTTAEKKEGRGLREQGLTISSPDQITLGLRTFQKTK